MDVGLRNTAGSSPALNPPLLLFGSDGTKITEPKISDHYLTDRRSRPLLAITSLQAVSIFYIQSVINAGVGSLCREKAQTVQWSSQQGALSWNEVFIFKLLMLVICVYRYQTD